MNMKVLSEVHFFFKELTAIGWFDKIAADIHPDRINAVCALVAAQALKLEDLKLVHVVWGNDEGIVSLAVGEVLVYACANHPEDSAFEPSSGLPKVELTDAEMDTAYNNEPTWENVPDYLVRVKGR
jgi:hypothetical protein